MENEKQTENTENMPNEKNNIIIIVVTLVILAGFIVILTSDNGKKEDGPADEAKQPLKPGTQLPGKPGDGSEASLNKLQAVEKIVAEAISYFPKNSPVIPVKARNYIRSYKGKPDIQKLLADKLRSSDPAHRRGALALLYEVGRADLVQEVLPLFLEDKNTHVISTAISLAGKIKSAKAYGALENIARGKKGKKSFNRGLILRHQAIRACVKIDRAKSEKLLLDILKQGRKDIPDTIKITALEQVLHLKLKSAAPEIFAIIKDKVSPQLWAGARRALLAVAPEKEPEILAHALIQESFSIKLSALERLAVYGKGTAVAAERAVVILKKDKYLKLRQAAVYALHKILDKGAIPHLISALADKDKAVRDALVKTLVKLTGQKFGTDQKKWAAWWKAKKK